MTDSNSQDKVARLLAGLSNPYAIRRRDDAKALGHIEVSNKEVVAALFNVANNDPDAAVREAAMVALAASVHQPFIPQVQAELAALQSTHPTHSNLKTCPACGKRNQAAEVLCRYCGSALPPSFGQSTAPYKATKQPGAPATRILTFLFFPSLWIYLVLNDPDSSPGVKFLALLMIILPLLLICVAWFVPHL